jgi:hypothetical protein
MDIEWAKTGRQSALILFRHVLKQFMGKIKNKCARFINLKKRALSHRNALEIK